MVFTKWEWDAGRKKNYYYDHDEYSYVYEDGERIPAPNQDGGQTQAAPVAASATSHARDPSQSGSDYSVLSAMSNMSFNDSAAPTYSGESADDQVPASVSTAQSAGPIASASFFRRGHGQHAHEANSQSEDPNRRNQAPQSQYRGHGGQQYPHYRGYPRSFPNPPPYGQQPNAIPLYNQGQYGIPQGDQGPWGPGCDTPVQSSYQNPTASSSQRAISEQEKEVCRDLELDPGEEVLPQELQNQGRRPRWKIRGTIGDAEPLDPSFYVREPGYAFFKVGVVFRMLWPELAGDAGNVTIATPPEGSIRGKRVYCNGQRVFCKIRWFVVVREGHNCCTCLSIQTYQGRGVTNTKVKSQHAIMYTGRKPPQQLPGEYPSHPNELPMGQPIRVIGDNERKPWDNKMDPKSRVNLVKVYTVEHNVKVEKFGFVDPAEEWKLISQFNSHWGLSGADPLPPADRYSSFAAPSSTYSAQSEVAPLPASHEGTAAAPGPSEFVPGGGFAPGLASECRPPFSMTSIQEDTGPDHQQTPYIQSAAYRQPGAVAGGMPPPAVSTLYAYPGSAPPPRDFSSQASNWGHGRRQQGYYGRRG